MTRLTYQRDGLRYASDIVEAEWAVIDRTCRCQRATGGRARRTWGMSSIPFSTWLNRAANGVCAQGFTGIYDGAAKFRCMARQWGVADNHVLLMDLREAAGRKRQSDRWCDRQPVGQDDRVRWPARLCGRKDDQGP
jgi:hypothetical protein